MSSTPIVDVMRAVATQLEAQLASQYDGIQVGAIAVLNPTPPTLDVFPGDPFGESISFDDGREQLFTIRARISTADLEAGQELLLSLMDRNGTSVIGAMRSDRTIGGSVDDSTIEGPSGYLPYPDVSGANGGSLLGCEWRLRALL